MIENTFNVSGRTTPQTLYHHTKPEAFRSIIRNGNFRASHFRLMNDRNELEYGRKQLLEWLNLRETDTHTGIKEGILDFVRLPVYDIPWDAYIVSFCSAADHIPMWSMYCTQERESLAIGFSFETIKNRGFYCKSIMHGRTESFSVDAKEDPGRKLLKCDYTWSVQNFEERFMRYFTDAVYADDFPFFSKATTGMIKSAFIESIFRSICEKKNPDFDFEKEYRYLRFAPNEQLFPPHIVDGRKMYIEYHFAPAEYISEVIISPYCCNPEKYRMEIFDFIGQGFLSKDCQIRVGGESLSNDWKESQ